LTASNFYNICTCKDKKETAKMLRYKKKKQQQQQGGGPTDTTEAMRYGVNMEEFVFQEVKKWFKVPVRKCGFMLHPDYDFIGASPDGLVGEHSVLEIKCLHTLRGQDTRPEWLWVEDGLFRLKETHPYYYQIQGELMCSEKENCVLVVYHQMARQCRIYTVFVARNQTFINKMIQDLTAFWERYYTVSVT
jgi:predicted phage-related endonuclease